MSTLEKVQFITKSGRQATAMKKIVTTHIIMGLEGHTNGLVSLIDESLLCVDNLTGNSFFCPVWAISEEELKNLPIEEEEEIFYEGGEE